MWQRSALPTLPTGCRTLLRAPVGQHTQRRVDKATFWYLVLHHSCAVCRLTCLVSMRSACRYTRSCGCFRVLACPLGPPHCTPGSRSLLLLSPSPSSRLVPEDDEREVVHLLWHRLCVRGGNTHSHLVRMSRMRNAAGTGRRHRKLDPAGASMRMEPKPGGRHASSAQRATWTRNSSLHFSRFVKDVSFVTSYTIKQASAPR